MKYILIIVLSTFFLNACTSEKERMEPTRTSKFDEFVVNPVTMEGPVDSSQAAIMQFDETIINFGTINEGDVVHYTYHFQNAGKSPMLISQAKSTCGCTVPDYPTEAIAPGERGEIKVKFNSENKTGFQDKPIVIYSNALPGQVELRLRGKVQENNNKKLSK